MSFTAKYSDHPILGMCATYYLVGGLEHFFIFLYIGNVIIPIDFHIFQRG